MSSASSAPLNTASTPSRGRASAQSTDLISACGCGERSTAACSMPGGLRSLVNVALPVSSAGSSRRLTSRPIHVRVSTAIGCPLDGVDDVLVARAPAEVAGQRGADLLLVGLRVALEQLGGGDQHPGRAEAALEAV